MKGQSRPPSWFGAKNYSGQPGPYAGRELTVPSEGGTQAQAAEAAPAKPSEAAHAHEGTQGYVGSGPGRSDADPNIETKPTGPADWEVGWKKRASLVAVCTFALLVFWIWAKGANEPSDPIEPSGPPPIAVGSLVEIKQGFFGCPKQSDLKQIEILAFSRHDAAAASLYRQSHSCPVLNKGEAVEVSDMASAKELLCIRWRSNPDCFWFPEQFVQQPSPKPPSASGGSDF